MQDPKNSLKTVSDLWFFSILSRIALQSRLTTHQTAYAKLRPPRRRVTREQNVVELNSKLPMREFVSFCRLTRCLGLRMEKRARNV